MADAAAAAVGRATLAGPAAPVVPLRARLGEVLRGLLPWKLLLNAVFWKDVVVGARGWRSFLGRGLYVAAILAIVLLPLLAASMGPGRAAVSIGSRDAIIASQVVATVQWAQLGLLMLVGMYAAAGAIADERISRSLESLFTTPITTAQIVWGKYASRVLQVSMLALYPLPILLMMRVLGGIDLEVVLMQFVLIISAIMLSIACSLVASVRARYPWRAASSVATAFLAMHILALLLSGLMAYLMGGSRAMWPLEAALQLVLPLYPFAAISNNQHTLSQLQLSNPWQLVAAASAAQISLSIVMVWIATLMLNRHSARASKARRRWRDMAPVAAAPDPQQGESAPHLPAEPSAPSQQPSRPEIMGSPKSAPSRPASTRVLRSWVVWDWPLIWRAFRQPLSDLRAGLRAGLVLKWLGLVGLVALLVMLGRISGQSFTDPEFYVVLYAILIGLTLSMSAVRTTSSIASEMQARTWEPLRTTPLSIGSILVQMLVGGAFWPVVRVVALHALLIYPAVFSRPHWVAIPLLLLIMLSTTVLFCATGLMFGAIARRSMAATVLNVGFIGGMWIFMPVLLTTLNVDERLISRLHPVTLSFQVFERTGDGWTRSGTDPVSLPNSDVLELLWMVLIQAALYLLASIAALFVTARVLPRSSQVR